MSKTPFVTLEKVKEIAKEYPTPFHIYDEKGKVLEKLPALEYSFGGTEYWTKGAPDGFPAIVQNFGYYEEDWQNGTIQEIRNEIELESIE